MSEHGKRARAIAHELRCGGTTNTTIAGLIDALADALDEGDSMRAEAASTDDDGGVAFVRVGGRPYKAPSSVVAALEGARATISKLRAEIRVNLNEGEALRERAVVAASEELAHFDAAIKQARFVGGGQLRELTTTAPGNGQVVIIARFEAESRTVVIVPDSNPGNPNGTHRQH